jgi:hypothetical protein
MIKGYFRRHIALPSDHGSWVFLLSPLLIGLFAGGSWSIATTLLIIAAFAAFLIRQPVTIIVKVYSKRRPRRDLEAAIFWIIVYGFIGLLALIGLIALGYGYVLYLAIPGIPVFIWHLYLISRRVERRKAGIEVVGSGVLALTAPAAYWIGIGYPDRIGWLLFILTWMQSAASIVYAYLRLEQRELDNPPEIKLRLGMGRRALLYTSFNLMAVIGLSIGGIIPPLLPIPYALQWAETLWGTMNPAIHEKPTKIGLRQLTVSTIFTIIFIITWNIELKVT